MKRYIQASEETTRFQIGREYKLYKKDMTEAVRTFTVENISHKQMKIKVKGGINGVFDIKDYGDHEMILLGMGDRNYCNPSSKDIL